MRWLSPPGVRPKPSGRRGPRPGGRPRQAPDRPDEEQRRRRDQGQRRDHRDQRDEDRQRSGEQGEHHRQAADDQRHHHGDADRGDRRRDVPGVDVGQAEGPAVDRDRRVLERQRRPADRQPGDDRRERQEQQDRDRAAPTESSGHVAPSRICAW
ncbi:MAG: hypothetical protein ACXWJ7_05690 [Caldimonas sp.]